MYINISLLVQNCIYHTSDKYIIGLLLQLVKPEMNMAQKYDYVFEFFKKMAGGEYLGFNNSVFLSERDSADRNFALAYFLRENLCFPPGDVNIPNILDFYFQVQDTL